MGQSKCNCDTNMSCVVCGQLPKGACGNGCNVLYCGETCADEHWTVQGHALVCAGVKRERPDAIVLVSGDGVQFAISAEEAIGSQVLVNLLDDASFNEEGEKQVLLNDIMSVELEHIVSYLKGNIKLAKNLSLSDLVRITNAANYLGISPLLEATSQKIVAFLFKGLRHGHEVAELQGRAMLTSEFSVDELKQLEKTYGPDGQYRLPNIRNVPLEPPSRDLTTPARITQLHKDFFMELVFPKLEWNQLKLFGKVNIRIYKMVTTYMLKLIRSWIPGSESASVARFAGGQRRSPSARHHREGRRQGT